MVDRAKRLWDRLRLWPHQKEAIETAQTYLRKWSPQKSSNGAALINIPTGGGKTAVMAVLAHSGHGVERALVLAPRVTIRDQLAIELSAKRDNGFFNKQGIKPSDLARPVHKLESASHVKHAVDGQAIFVSTIQLLDRYRQDASSAFAKFAGTIDIVLIDEGHYEPAPSWSITARSFDRPYVLFTATPYRNDLRAFNIDASAVHVTQFADAVEKNFLRSVEIVPLAHQSAPDAFVKGVLEGFKREFGAPPNSEQKLIVRCESKDNVAKVAQLFVQRGLTVVALHERFTKADSVAEPWKRRAPRDPEEQTAPRRLGSSAQIARGSRRTNLQSSCILWCSRVSASVGPANWPDHPQSRSAGRCNALSSLTTTTGASNEIGSDTRSTTRP